MMRPLRAIAIILGFAVFTLPLMPLQWLFVATGSRWASVFPHWYHTQVARLFGVKIHKEGTIEKHQPVLLVANHASWLDIIVLSAVTPTSFVAKKEIRNWPFVGWLARLQRTVFIDRERRSALKHTSREIADRLHQGDKILFFPEGTSGNGNRVLPFKSSLFAAIRPGSRAESGNDMAPDLSDVLVQTVTVAYTHAGGLPLGRIGRPRVAWYGDINLASHAWQLFSSGPVDVHVAIGKPLPLESFADRKALASTTECQVRNALAAMLTNGGPLNTVELAPDATQDKTAVQPENPGAMPAT